MRRGSWTCALALGLGLSLAALARADDDDVKPAKTGNWFTRLFKRNSADKKKDDNKKEAAAAPATPAPALARQKAYGEWQRRTEVCYKLKQIAIETGDKDLDRKADALDQRAWELYVQHTGAKDKMSSDQPHLEIQLGIETDRDNGPESVRPSTSGRGATGGNAAATSGKNVERRD